MKKSLINIAILISVSVVILAGCSTNTQRENTTIGAVSGAVVGGLAGSLIGGGTGQVVAIGVGAVAGALAGGYIGHSMDSTDNNSAHQALNNPTNQSSTWENKKTGTQYTVRPTSRVMTYKGHKHCRKFETTAIISGKTHTMHGIACRQADGSWVSMK